MERSELIRRMILNSICDDYENVDQVILRDVRQDCAKFGFTVERPEVRDALAGLVKDGLAKAYVLSPVCTELPGMAPLDVIEENFTTYFYITKKGMDLHLSEDSWWPFDDED